MRQTAAEAAPWRCYRSLIADALIVRGNRDEHIMNRRTFRVHSLTSFGRVRRNRITYPLSKPGPSSHDSKRPTA
jgi:uncharacterized protein (DUF488 family)